MPRVLYPYGQDHNKDIFELFLVEPNDILSLNNTGGAIREAFKEAFLTPSQRISWFHEKEKEKIDLLATIPSEIRTDYYKLGFANGFPAIQLPPFDENVNINARKAYLKKIKVSMCTTIISRF